MPRWCSTLDHLRMRGAGGARNRRFCVDLTIGLPLESKEFGLLGLLRGGVLGGLPGGLPCGERGLNLTRDVR